MPMPTKPGSFACAVCGKERDEHEGKPLDLVNHPLDDLIRRDHPDLEGSAPICLSCRNRYRTAYVRDVISTDRGEISAIENEVLRSLEQQDLLARNINPEFDRALTLGGRVADKMAEFGGSWTFIVAFAVVLVGWIALNTAATARAFDPYPYILLNLVLSCIAAMQAPVIMMSQNRQEAKDRLRAEHDYQVNLKAEIEIRQLHVKLDQLIRNQWHRLLEIQRVQMELIEDLAERPGPNGAAGA
jgi:uncharacterized membrane protein